MTTHPKITEAELQASVIDAAHQLGWRCCHFRPALTGRGWRTAVQGDGVGFPDTVMCRGSRLLFAEIKSARGTLSDAQRGWLAALRQTGAEVWLWTPEQWFDGTVVRVLSGAVAEVLDLHPERVGQPVRLRDAGLGGPEFPRREGRPADPNAPRDGGLAVLPSVPDREGGPDFSDAVHVPDGNTSATGGQTRLTSGRRAFTMASVAEGGLNPLRPINHLARGD